MGSRTLSERLLDMGLAETAAHGSHTLIHLCAEAALEVELHQWRRCADRMPGSGVMVLAYFPDIKSIEMAQEDGGYWHYPNGGVICNPKQHPRPAVAASHWMPLPDAPL